MKKFKNYKLYKHIDWPGVINTIQFTFSLYNKFRI